MAVSSSSELIDDHVSSSQCTKAIEALLKHSRAHQEKQAETELLPGAEPHVWLVLATKKMSPEKKLKPFKIPIVHPLVDPRTSGVCLIVKDPQREYKDLLEKNGIKFISRVVGIEKLKGKWKPFEARRLLLRENGLFLADERVVPLLPKLLGKEFFKAKKQPIPVCITRKDLKGELERAISSTYMHQNQGTCTSIKVGTLSQTSAQIAANIRSALPAVVKHVNGGWDNVQAFHLKTNASVALPIWSCKLESGEGGRWDSLAATGEAEVDDDDEAEEEKEKTQKRGKKRTAATSVEAAMLPTKKAKPSPPAPASVEAPTPVAETTTTKTTKKVKKLPKSATVEPAVTEVAATTTTTIASATTTSAPAPTKVSKKKSVKIVDPVEAVETTIVEEVDTVSPAVKPTRSGKSKVRTVAVLDESTEEAVPKPSKASSKKKEAPKPTPTDVSMAELKVKKAALGGGGERKKGKAALGAQARGVAKKEVLGRKK